MKRRPLAERGAAAIQATGGHSPVDKEKRLKKLRKVVKAIEQIKEKVAAGQEINEDQQNKLKAEAETLAEIEELEKDP